MRSNKPKTSDETDSGEKNREDDNESAVAETDEADRCPICLNLFLRQELAVPESCCHVFCLTCILKWAEVNRGTCSQQLVKNDFSSKSLSGGQLSGSCISVSESCADFLDVYEGEPLLRQKRCRLETCERPWLPVSTAVPADGLVRQCSDPSEMLNGLFPLRSLLPDSTSPTNPFAAGHFIFVGKECAVTCSKGEEKKSSSRASGPKSSKNKSESSTTRRRSTRNSRTDESSPVQDPSSSQSNHSDSDSSVTNTSAKASSISKKPERQAAKRKSKQAAKEKRPVKRKGRATRNTSNKPTSSPEGSDVEQQQVEEEEEKEAAECSDLLLSDGDQNPNTQMDDSSQHSSPEDNYTETSGHISEHEDNNTRSSAEMMINDKRKDDSSDEEESTSQINDDLPPLTVKEKQDEDPAVQPNRFLLSSDEEVFKDSAVSPCSQKSLTLEGENVEDKADSVCCDPPLSSLEKYEEVRAESASEKEDSMSFSSERPYSPVDINMDDMEAIAHGVSSESEAKEWSSEKCISPQPVNESSEHTDPKACSDDLEEFHHSDKESKETVDNESKADQPNRAIPKKSQEELDVEGKSLQGCEHFHIDPQVTESVDSSECKNGVSFAEDNNEMVPMECDSPNSELSELKTEENKTEHASSTAVRLVSDSQASENDKKMEQKTPDETTESSTTEQKEPEKKEGRQRKSRFHSPSTTWSPKRDSKKERRRSRSRSRERDATPPTRRRSRTRSRDRESDSHRRDRSRERERRGRRRSRSRSRSRTYGRGSSSERTERGGHSPWRRDRWSNDSWRSSRGNDRQRRSDQEKQSDFLGKESNEPDSGGYAEIPPERGRTENPDWVKEKVKSDLELRSRDTGVLNESRWDENKNDGAGDSWNRSFSPGGWKSDRGRGGGSGRGGGFRGGFGQAEPIENRWQPRNSFSGISNNSGNDSYSRFNENRHNRRKGDQDFVAEPPVDRSGWSSASSWAVRRTLPADVQNYYSRKGRNSSGSQGGWMKQEEETPGQDATVNEQNSQPGDCQQLPVNVMHHQMNVIPQPVNPQPINPQPVNILQFPMGVPTPAMNIQPAPFNMSHQLPVHIHSAVPLMQVPAPGSQGLPPPPPPPPPTQQASFVAPQLDSKQPQAVTSAQGGNKFSAPLLPNPTKVPGSAVQGPPSIILPSSTTQSSAAGKSILSKETIRVEVNADSSKKEKKLQIQERAIQEVKLAIKPYYQNKDITKDEYKEIVRKAVDKICHSKSGEVNSAKVANLVKAYVDKYKHARKNKTEDHGKL
nr:PREDICTED: protein SCAF11 [Lepisosteus oculatus]